MRLCLQCSTIELKKFLLKFNQLLIIGKMVLRAAKVSKKKKDVEDDDSNDANTSTEEENNECKPWHELKLYLL